ALQCDLAVRLKTESIGGFPYRAFHDIADPHRALADAVHADADGFLLRVMRTGKHLQGTLEFVLQGCILKSHRDDLLHRDGLQAGVLRLRISTSVATTVSVVRRCDSMPMMVPLILAGGASFFWASVMSIFSPRAWLRICPKVGFMVKSSAKLRRILSMGSLES